MTQTKTATIAVLETQSADNIMGYDNAALYLYYHNMTGTYEWRRKRLSGTHACHYICTRAEYKDTYHQLLNKPYFQNHPDAKCLMQDSDGWWWKNTETADIVPHSTYSWWSSGRGKEGMVRIQRGVVLGDWRQTLHVRESLTESPDKPQSREHWIKQAELKTGVRRMYGEKIHDAMASGELPVPEDAPCLVPDDILTALRAMDIEEKKKALARESPNKAWSGPQDGYPPVGTVCGCVYINAIPSDKESLGIVTIQEYEGYACGFYMHTEGEEKVLHLANLQFYKL